MPLDVYTIYSYKISNWDEWESVCINYPTNKQKVVSQTAFKKKTISKLIPLETELFFIPSFFSSFARNGFGSSALPVYMLACLPLIPKYPWPGPSNSICSIHWRSSMCRKSCIEMYFRTFFSLFLTSIKYASCNATDGNDADDEGEWRRRAFTSKRTTQHKFSIQTPKICIYYRYPDKQAWWFRRISSSMDVIHAICNTKLIHFDKFIEANINSMTTSSIRRMISMISFYRPIQTSFRPFFAHIFVSDFEQLDFSIQFETWNDISFIIFI